MKVAFLVDTHLNAGGGNTAIVSECNSIKKLLDKNIELSFLTTSKENKNYLEQNFSDSIIFFNKDLLINKIYLFLVQSGFFKFLIKRTKIKNLLKNYYLKMILICLFFLHLVI